ncbi:MAG: NUDIX hydrolase [Bacteroidales bacterium]|nr:NUDIX hydrolase [Bacteroidales bacterium]
MGKNYIYVKGAEFPYQYKYEHMAVTTDCVIFTYEDWTLKVLLVRRGGEPYKGEWAFPGGFMKLDETAKEGALRELWEETSLETSAVRELGVFSDVDRDPRERVITIAYYALIKPSEVIGGDDAEEAAWFTIDKLPVLAFDHQKIFDAAMQRLRRDIHFEPVGFDLLDDEFTIPDLQRLYEIILGTKFDRRNFQRKVFASGILEEAPKEEEPAIEACEAPMPMMMASMSFEEAAPKPKKRPGRIASLFRLNKAKYDAMKEEGDKYEF